MKKHRHKTGFTLAELLIALLILGEIATFTIPKILSARENQQMNAVAKEDIAALGQAFQLMQLEGKVSTSTTAGDLLPYLSYVKLDTTSGIDDAYNFAGGQGCTAGEPCAIMHNGSAIKFNNCSFNGTNPNANVIEVFIDPDGKVTAGGGAQSNGKSIRAFIYYSGRVTSWSGVLGGSGSSCFGWGPGTDPPYLKW